MRPGARTPEELETLFEDAFVVRDRDAIAELFEDGGLLDSQVARFCTLDDPLHLLRRAAHDVPSVWAVGD